MPDPTNTPSSSSSSSNSSEPDKQAPSIGGDCCNIPFSDEPINFATGEIGLAETDFEWQGLGFSWTQSRSYANIVTGSSPGRLGNNWFMSSFPRLSFGSSRSGDTISIVKGVWDSEWFVQEPDGSWKNRFGKPISLTHKPESQEFTLLHSSGLTEVFYDESDFRSGKLKAIRSASGAAANVNYSASGDLESIEWTGTDGNKAIFSYHYFYDPERFGLLSEVTLSVSDVEIRKASYDYYISGDEHGPSQTLKCAEVKARDEGNWESLGKQWYRYYKGESNVGVPFGVKLSFNELGVKAAQAAGFNMDDSDDADLSAFATHHYEYDSAARVTREILRGGETEREFSWLENEADPQFVDANTWKRRSIETRPDGTKKIVYSNTAGAATLKITEEIASGDRWFDYFEYNSESQLVLQASSAAVQSVSEPANSSGDLTVTLKENEGLITVNTFYTENDFDNGKVKGYIESKGTKKGATGNVELIKKWTYDTHYVDGINIHPNKEEIVFQNPGTAEAEAPRTTFERIYHTDNDGNPTFQTRLASVTQPLVSTDENGSGLEEKIDLIYNENGFNTWTRDARGIITRTFYNEHTGAVSRVIEDADPSKLEDAPLGWSAPTFGGAHLVTDFENDRLSRTIRKIGPEHKAIVDKLDDESRGIESVTTRKLRSVEYTMYLCPRHQTWTAKGFVAGYGTPDQSWNLVGPVSIEQRDSAGNVTDMIEVIPECDCGPLSTSSCGELNAYFQLPDRALWSSWSHTMRDTWGRDIGNRDYTDIPLSGDGFQNEGYYETELSYDAMRRPYRAVSRDGTISQIVFTPFGEQAEVWGGTDDTGASSADPGNGGTNGNNMKPVRIFEYDYNSASGNQNVTKVTLPVDDDSANDRITDLKYDYLNRVEQTWRSDGTTTFIESLTYDNIGNQVSQTGYHNMPIEGNRNSHREMKLDSHSRPFQEKTFGVDPDTGNLTEALASETWFDENNNIVKRIEQGQAGATKIEYNGRNQEVRTYQVVEGASGNLADDIVAEQSQIIFDEQGNRVSEIQFQRLPSATATGVLGAPGSELPNARVSYQFHYFDSIGRSRFVADFGTNGGTEPDRPATPPTSSETILVIEGRYNLAGRPCEAISADGVAKKTDFNNLTQMVKTTEAYGTDDQRIQQYRWHPSGKISHLILENEDTGQQVTSWEFGSTLTESNIARNDLVIEKHYPTGEFYTYSVNRQAELKRETQPNGTEHLYERNHFGAMLHDSATQLGNEIDDEVRRITRTYNSRALVDTITSWDHTDPETANPINQVKYQYDAFNQIVGDYQAHDGEVTTSTPVVTYEHANGLGNTLRQTASITPAGKRVDWDYGESGSIEQAFNLPKTLRVAGESHDLVEYQYSGLSMLTQVAYPGPDIEQSFIGSSTTTGDAGDEITGYDRFGRVNQITWKDRSNETILVDLEYGHDQASRITWRADLTPEAGGNHNRFYAYDALGQIKSSEVGKINRNRTDICGLAKQSESWNYDQTGNWMGYQATDQSSSTPTGYQTPDQSSTVIDQTRSHTAANRLAAIDGSNSRVSHDLNGNMTQIPTGKDLQDPGHLAKWDAWNRLVELRDAADDSLVGKYSYDGSYRRTLKQVDDGVESHAYYNVDWRIVEEKSNSAALPESVYHWGARGIYSSSLGEEDEVEFLGSRDLIRRDRDTNQDGNFDESFYCLKDILDTVAIVNWNGVIQERYEFTVFGDESILEGNYSKRPNSAYDWSFLHHEAFRDSESGMYNFGYRFYQPRIGRWLSPDLIELSSGNVVEMLPEGSNLYCYGPNAPINGFDSRGRFWSWGAVLAGAALGALVGVVATVVQEGVNALQGGRCYHFDSDRFKSNMILNAGGGAIAGGALGAVAGAITGDPSAAIVGGSVMVATGASIGAGGAMGLFLGLADGEDGCWD